MVATVLVSILAHGLTARPGIDAYAARIAALDARAREHGNVAGEERAPERVAR